MEFNWKCKNDNDEIVYKYTHCVFCQCEWHSDTTPIQHLFRQCSAVHQQISVNIDPNDEIEKIYGKWNLVLISKLANLIHNKIKKVIFKVLLKWL